MAVMTLTRAHPSTRKRPSSSVEAPALFARTSGVSARTRMQLAGPLAALPLIALLLPGCVPDTEIGLSSPVRWLLSPEPEVTIGLQEGDPDYLFGRIADGVLLPHGEIAVADRVMRTVRVYDSSGIFLRDLGRSGEGPGEFQSIMAIWASGDTVSVFDNRIFRLTRFRIDGSLAETLRILPEGRRPNIPIGVFTNGDLALGWIKNLLGGGPSPDTIAFGRFDEAGHLTAELGIGLGFRRDENGTVPFSPMWNAAVYLDSIYFTDGLKPGISIWSPAGERARTIPLPDAQLDTEEAWRAVRAELVSRGDLENLREFDETPRPDALPDIARMFIDPDGLIWVKRYDPLTDANALGGFLWWNGGEWWVLDRAGIHLATVQMPPHFMPLHVRGDRVLGFFRDDLRVERIQVFRLRRPR